MPTCYSRVALRVLEVPLARLVSPGAAAVAPPTVALAGLGVPLFFSWSPDSRFIVQVRPQTLMLQVLKTLVYQNWQIYPVPQSRENTA